MRSAIKILLAGLTLWVAAAAGAAHAHEGLAADPAVRGFIEEMHERHGFERASLERLFTGVRLQNGVLEAISRPAEAKPWYEYRRIFVTPERIRDGVRFWRSHRETLEEAAAAYGVAPEIVVAIIGVETRYGEYTGRTPVLDALTTLAFRYPRRSGFFRRELEQFLLLAREEGLDPGAITGSYAGAMGLPQFIASSYRRYAVDFDGDQVRDLLGNYADAIGSVANYLKVHGWRPGTPVALAASPSGEGFRALLERGLKPRTPVLAMRERGLDVHGEAPDDALGALIELQAREGREYWVGLQNFYAITRYNHSALYAMAVHQLAEAIRRSYAEAARS